MTETVLSALVVLCAGLLIGWLLGQRGVARAKAERDEREGQFKQAIIDLARAEERLKAQEEAKAAMAAQFGQVAGAALESAQRQFLERADARFRQSEESAGQNLKALLQPVEATLKRYEEGLTRVEKEREGSYRELNRVVSQLATSNESVVRETQRLANVMRSSPKARGRWGEEQLRTILENAGLHENIDFALQTSVTDGERTLRPDCIINLPGDRCIVVDVKNVWTAFEQAFDEEDEQRRAELLRQHADAMRSHASDLGRKGYWRQFDRSPDFVIMFVPGEHLLSAAAERAPDLIEAAYRNGVIIASTINMLALAKVMAGMWRQEKLAETAQAVAALGKELYARLATMGGHVARLGKNLATASAAYNDMIGSLESKVLTQAQRFEELGIEPSAKRIEPLPVADVSIRSLNKLSEREDGLSPADAISGRDAA